MEPTEEHELQDEHRDAVVPADDPDDGVSWPRETCVGGLRVREAHDRVKIQDSRRNSLLQSVVT